MTITSACDHILFLMQISTMNGLSLLDCFSIISDPRRQCKVEHKLYDILFIAIVVVIGGAEDWEEIECLALTI